MSSIERATLKITTAAVLIGSTVAGVTSYYSAMNGVKEGLYQFKLETTIKIHDLENKDILHDRDISDLQKRVK